MKTATFSIFAKMVVLFLATFITTTLLAPLMLKVEHADAMNWYVQCYFIHIAFHDISIEVYIIRVHMHLYYFILGGWLKSKIIQRVVLKFFYCCWYICIYYKRKDSGRRKECSNCIRKTYYIIHSTLFVSYEMSDAQLFWRNKHVQADTPLPADALKMRVLNAATIILVNTLL